VTLSTAAAAPSALRLTWSSPLYRGATIALFLSGLGMSAAAPQIASFLVNELGSSLTVAGLFYLTNLTAPVAGYLVGSWSDRTGRRLGLFRAAAVAGFVSWAAFAFSTELWMPFVLTAVVGGFAGASGSQLFAAIHDETQRHPAPNSDGVVAIVRMALTAGWVIGPVAGSFLAAQTSLRTMLFATALCNLAQLLPLGTLRTPPPLNRAGTATGPATNVPVATVPAVTVPAVTVPAATKPAATKPAATKLTATVPAPTRPAARPGADRRGPGLRAMLPLLAFTGLYVLVYAGESIKFAYLPIYMDTELALPAALSGAIIGIQPLVEIVLMPVAVIVARRIGLMRLMAIGASLGLAANLFFASGDTAAALFTGQILMGGVWGVFAALGIIAAQRLLPTAVATASAVFMSSMAVSSALGGAAGGIGAATMGLPVVFLIPAVCALLATIGLIVMDRVRPGL
jgi:SET family sugar efflux transporter-like MFS transporter